MAQTDFALNQGGPIVLWEKKLWSDTRDLMFMNKFWGGADAPIHRLTNLNGVKGEQIKFQLVSDLVEDGIVGDGEREGRGEKLSNFYDTITLDLITHSVEDTGKLANKKTVIDFRQQANDKLKYWLANRLDQLQILTMSSIPYSLNLDGSTRASTAFTDLAFADEVASRSPTAGRHFRVTNDASGVYTGLAAGATASIDATDTLSYKAIVDVCVKARRNYLPGMMKNGKEHYICMVSPEGYSQLKKDSDFQNAIINAGVRGESNQWFTGGIMTIDGIVFHEHRLVFHTKGAASGSKWGSGGTVDGSRALIVGRQALGMVDLGAPSWVEKKFQYNSQVGINVDKMFGLIKPQFYNVHTGRKEDFGVLALDHAID